MSRRLIFIAAVTALIFVAFFLWWPSLIQGMQAMHNAGSALQGSR